MNARNHFTKEERLVIKVSTEFFVSQGLHVCPSRPMEASFGGLREWATLTIACPTPIGAKNLVLNSVVLGFDFYREKGIK
jgi:hypothetical protein